MSSILIEELAEQAFESTCCEVAVCTLIAYEHITTFSQEYELMWGTKMTGATLIFFVNRYLLLAYCIVTPLQVISWDTPLRFVLKPIVMSKPFLITLYAAVAAFTALRTFAISGHSRYLALITLALALMPFCTTIYITIKQSYAYVVWFGVLTCLLFSLVIITRVCAITADVLVLATTWYKTYAIKREADLANVRVSLVTLLLRDGTLYFAIILMMNIVQIITGTINSLFNYVTVFLAPISSILISRFLLNLRQLSHPGSDTCVEDLSFVGPLPTQSQHGELPNVHFAVTIDEFRESL
ncbi:hypothetical protein AcV5_008776 [Taiwanofungus camphoratus]|nr:hypothetical protein AcV5_008776 [Antrodia cinnamomea]